MHSCTVSCSFEFWFQTSISFAISCCLDVIIFFAISLFTSSHTFSIGFISGKFPGQGNRAYRGIFCSCRKAFTERAVWQGAPSCMKMKDSPLANQSLTWLRSLSFSICLYWSCFIITWTTYRQPVPFLLITDQIMTLVICFIVYNTFWMIFFKRDPSHKLRFLR